MDIPNEPCYVLCNVQRNERRPQNIGGSTRHAGPDDFEDTARDGSTARIRNRPPAGARERTRAAVKRRAGVHLAVAPAARTMDRRGVGRFRKQSEGQVLFDYEKRAETAAEGD